MFIVALTLDKNLELLVTDGSLVQTDLQCQLQREQELVIFIQSATGVPKSLECQVFYVVVDPLVVQGRLFRPVRKRVVLNFSSSQTTYCF